MLLRSLTTIKFIFILLFFCVVVDVNALVTKWNKENKKSIEKVPEERVDFYRTMISDGLDYYVKSSKFTDPFRSILKCLFDMLIPADEPKCPVCFFCNITVTLFLRKFKSGFIRRQHIERFSIRSCEMFLGYHKDVCTGITNGALDVILYIINKNPKLTAERMCSTIFQHKFCDAGIPEWSVNIPKGHTIERNWGLVNQSDKPIVRVLHVTDIHYDATYEEGTNSNCNKPLCCSKDSGPAQPQYVSGYWSSYIRCDTPKHTIMESLKHMAKQNFDFVYFTGDIVSHRIWDRTVESNKEDIKTIYAEMKKIFGVKPIFSVLGNHEPHFLNLFAPLKETNKNFSTQWLYDQAAESWSAWIPKDQLQTVKKGGFYTILVKKGFRVVGLNNNVCYTFNWWLLDGTGQDPYGQLKWLVEVLLRAEINKESVHILAHVPNNDEMCYRIWSREFRRIVNRFANTITGIFNGHTHLDEFYLFHNESNQDQAIAVAWNGGSLTTYTDLNLNYKIYDVDPKSFELTDIHQYTFDLELANKNKRIDWYRLYAFKTTYEVNNLSPKSMRQLVVNMSKDRCLLEKYESYMSRLSSSPNLPGCDKTCLKDLHCMLLTGEALNKQHCTRLKVVW